MRENKKVYLYVQKWTFDNDWEPELIVSLEPNLKSSDDRVIKLVDSKPVVFEVPDNWQNVNIDCIESLKMKKQRLLAEAEVKAKSIDEKIQSLLAIEGK